MSSLKSSKYYPYLLLVLSGMSWFLTLYVLGQNLYPWVNLLLWLVLDYLAVLVSYIVLYDVVGYLSEKSDDYPSHPWLAGYKHYYAELFVLVPSPNTREKLHLISHPSRWWKPFRYGVYALCGLTIIYRLSAGLILVVWPAMIMMTFKLSMMTWKVLNQSIE